MEEKTEQQKFLEDLTPKDENLDPFAPKEEVKEEVTEEKTETAEEIEQRGKNRRERRLLEKNQQLREEAIMLAAKLEGIKEARALRETTGEADYEKLVTKIYGTATPEASEATEVLKQALKGVHESAKKEALEEALSKFREEREKESKEVADEERNLDEMLENLEDDHNADFSNKETKQGFLTLLEKLSPKDRDGNIVEYADPETTWEIFQDRNKKSTSRAKELADRSMTRSGAPQDSKLEASVLETELKRMGII